MVTPAATSAQHDPQPPQPPQQQQQQQQQQQPRMSSHASSLGQGSSGGAGGASAGPPVAAVGPGQLAVVRLGAKVSALEAAAQDAERRLGEALRELGEQRDHAARLEQELLNAREAKRRVEAEHEGVAGELQAKVRTRDALVCRAPPCVVRARTPRLTLRRRLPPRAQLAGAMTAHQEAARQLEARKAEHLALATSRDRTTTQLRQEVLSLQRALAKAQAANHAAEQRAEQQDALTAGLEKELQRLSGQADELLRAQAAQRLALQQHQERLDARLVAQESMAQALQAKQQALQAATEVRHHPTAARKR